MGVGKSDSGKQRQLRCTGRWQSTHVTMLESALPFLQRFSSAATQPSILRAICSSVLCTRGTMWHSLELKTCFLGDISSVEMNNLEKTLVMRRGILFFHFSISIWSYPYIGIKSDNRYTSHHILNLQAYHQVSDTRHTLVGHKINDHSDVVGASPVVAAPTTYSFSTLHLAAMDWAKTTARQDEKHFCLGIGCDLY